MTLLGWIVVVAVALAVLLECFVAEPRRRRKARKRECERIRQLAERQREWMAARPEEHKVLGWRGTDGVRHGR